MLVDDSNKKKLLRDTHLTFVSFSNIEIEFSHVMGSEAKSRLYRKTLQSRYAVLHERYAVGLVIFFCDYI